MIPRALRASNATQS